MSLLCFPDLELLRNLDSRKTHFDIGVEEENSPLEIARRGLFPGMWLWSFLAPGGKKITPHFCQFLTLSKEKTRGSRQLSEVACCQDAEDSWQSPRSLSIDSEDAQLMSSQSLILSTNIAFTSKSIKYHFVHSNYFLRIVPESRSI